MKPIKKKTLVFLTILILGYFSGITSARVDVDLRTYLSDNRITVGEDFTVELKITNRDTIELTPEDDIDVRIWVDDVLVHDKEGYHVDHTLNESESAWINISSNDFEVDGKKIWKENLMDYECGENKEVRVEISGDVYTTEDYDELTIEPKREENELHFTISPKYPKIDERIIITVYDERDEELRDARVKFTRLGDNDEWDYDDDSREKRTDENGEVEVILKDDYRFKDDPYSKYQVDVWVRGEYCKVTKYFDSRRKLNLTNLPEKAFVGKSIEVRVLDDQGKAVSGAKIAVSKAGIAPKFFETNSEGYASFTLQEPGDYTLLASKTGYLESEIINLKAEVRGTVGVSIKPEEPVVGKSVKIVVTNSEGALLPGAKVVITKPDGSNEPVETTPETGQISYTPLSPGEYKVNVQEASHKPKDVTFTAMNEFSLTLPKEIKVYKETTIVVKNQNDLLVEGATVSVSGTTIAGKTNKDGKFSFTLEEPGDYTITVKKEGFRDKSESITVQGELSLKISSEKVEVGEAVSFTVLDAQGKEVKDAVIEVTKPNGSKEKISGKSYLPSSPGNYTITASKANYQSGKASLVVKKLPLTLTAEVKGDTLVVTATSKGKPVQDLPIVVETIFGGEEVFTDETGKAKIKFENLTEEMEVTVKVEAEKYESKSLEKTITPPVSIPWEWVLGIILVILIIVAIYLGEKRKGGKKEKPTVALPKRRSSLQGT